MGEKPLSWKRQSIDRILRRVIFLILILGSVPDIMIHIEIKALLNI